MKKLRGAPLLLLGLLALALLCSRVDYARLRSAQAPLFALETRAFKDGGSTIYTGPFYQLVYWHRLARRDEKSGHETGVELAYFPFFRDWGFSSGAIEPGVPLEFIPR